VTARVLSPEGTRFIFENPFQLLSAEDISINPIFIDGNCSSVDQSCRILGLLVMEAGLTGDAASAAISNGVRGAS
jgi:hypothetical protein